MTTKGLNLQVPFLCSYQHQNWTIASTTMPSSFRLPVAEQQATKAKIDPSWLPKN